MWELSIGFLERQLASNGFLLDVVGSEGQVARGRERASFGTVPRLVYGLFLSCLGGCVKSGSTCADAPMGSFWTWLGQKGRLREAVGGLLLALCQACFSPV